jgi:hypothetical protein
LDVQIEEIKTSWLGGSSPMDTDQRETAGNYSKYGEFTELDPGQRIDRSGKAKQHSFIFL